MEKTKIIKSTGKPRNRILIATATLGRVRFEWASARWGQIIPCNWSNSFIPVGINSLAPIDYLVADAQNIAVQEIVDKDYEWLLLHEDDVVLPADCFLRFNDYMRRATIPVVSGLYYTKGEPSEPILYRGRGNSYYDNWKRGDKIWVDGVPTGCLLIHNSILKLMHSESESYTIAQPGIVRQVRKVFETPRKVWLDPESGQHCAGIGTSDLDWCDKVINNNILQRTGWPEIARKKYVFLVDTNIFCRHIDLITGTQYPQE